MTIPSQLTSVTTLFDFVYFYSFDLHYSVMKTSGDRILFFKMHLHLAEISSSIFIQLLSHRFE